MSFLQPKFDPIAHEFQRNEELVDNTRNIMRRKLADGALKGKAGWWDEQQCSLNRLHSLTKKAFDEGDFENLVVYAAMLARRIQLMPDL